MVKKQKLVVSICAPLAVAGIAAGVTSAVLLSKNKQTPSMGDCRVSFQVNEDARFVDDISPIQNVYSGTTLDHIAQPRVQSYRPNRIFTGWVDETKNSIPGQYKILKNAKLTASFGDTTTGDYATVTFKKKPGEPDVTLLGNVSVGVKYGWKFLMVNRPTAEWDGNYFEYWEYYDSDKGEYVKFDDTAVIDKEEIVLYPKFTKAVKVTWNYGKGGILVRGQPTTSLSANTAFDKFNQPQLANIDLSLKFGGWFKNEACTDPWLATDIVTDDTTAYAKWVTGERAQDGNYCVLSFVQNLDQQELEETPDIIYAPSTTQIIQIAETVGETRTPISVHWNNTIKPTVSTADGNYELDRWQYNLDPEHPEWTNFPEDYVFPTDVRTKPIEIRAWIKSSVSDISISGPDSILPESKTNYTAIVSGTEENPYISQSVEWGLFGDEECKKPILSGAKLEDGLLTVDSLTKATTYYIRAISKANPDYKYVKRVDLHMPYEDSQMIWFHNGKQWFSIAQKDGLCTDGSSITAYALDQTSSTPVWQFSKSETFEYDLHIGGLLNTIYDQFGLKWTGFNGNVDLTNSNITKIGGSFLEDCTSFNKPLDLSKISSIGQNFLYRCESFDSTITLIDSDGNSQLQSIGQNFLGGCTSYNHELVLPNNAIEIGDAFLYGCVNFNQNLTIPANIVKIHDFFMMGCDSFTSTLTINSTDEDIWVANENNISSTDSGAPIYTEGFEVDGDGAETFMSLFPTHFTDHAYRTVRSATPVTPTTWLTAAEWTAAVNGIFPVMTTTSYTGLNYSVQTPENWGNQYILVDGAHNAEQIPMEKETYFDGGNTYNNVWKKYNGSGFSEFTQKTSDPLFMNLITLFRKGLYSESFKYDPQTVSEVTTDANWSFNSKLNRYTTKNKMPIYPKGENENPMYATVSITFNSEKKISMITMTEDSGTSSSWGFKHDKVTIDPKDYPDDHMLQSLAEVEASKTTHANSSNMQFLETGTSYQFTIKSKTDGFGSVKTNNKAKVWVSTAAAPTAPIAFNNTDYTHWIAWFDSNGKWIGQTNNNSDTTTTEIWFDLPDQAGYPPVETLWSFAISSNEISGADWIVHVELSSK